MNLLSSDALRRLRESLPATGPFIFRMSRAAGADMNEMRRFTAAEAEEFSRLGQETFEAIERLPFLTVVAIDGDCFGGALDLAMAFDLRYATPRSRFAHPGAKLGIVTGFGGTSRWRKVMSPAAARRLFLANATLTAEEAHAAGLVDVIGEPDVERLGALDPNVVRMLKELARHAGRLSQSEALRLAQRLGELYFRNEKSYRSTRRPTR